MIEKYSVIDISKKYNVSSSVIDNIFKYLNIKKRTNSESKKTDKYISKIENTNMDKYGYKNPSSNPEVRKKRKKTFLKNNGYINNFSNVSILNKALNNIDYKKVYESNKKTCKEKYGVNNVSQIDWVVKKISNTKKKFYKKLTYEEKLKMTEKARQCINYESKIQLRVQSIINKLNISYTSNTFLWRYNYDFVFKNKKILEIQGEFWHANPKKYKKNDILLKNLTAGDIWDKDLKKKNKAIKNGYDIYYLWEDEINNMSDDDILNFLIKNIIL